MPGPVLRTARIVFARNSKGANVPRGDIEFTLDYRYFKNVKSGKIYLTCTPGQATTFPNCAINIGTDFPGSATWVQADCCEPMVLNQHGDGMTDANATAGSSASIGPCQRTMNRFPSNKWTFPNVVYKMPSAEDFFSIDVVFEDVVYVTGCENKTAILVVCDSLIKTGTGYLTMSLLGGGWDIENRMVQVASVSDSFYWYPVLNCPTHVQNVVGTGPVNTKGGTPESHPCYPKDIDNEEFYVFAGGHGGLGVSAPGMAKLNTHRDIGGLVPAHVDGKLGSSKCHGCYPIDTANRILNTDANGVPSPNPAADGQCQLIERDVSTDPITETVKGKKLFNDEGPPSTAPTFPGCGRYAALVKSQPINTTAAENDDCTTCIAGNAKECARSVIRALFALGWGKGATVRVSKTTQEEQNNADGYTNEGDRTCVEMTSTSYALNQRHTFTFAPPKADGWSGDDKHLGISYGTHGGKLNTNLYKYPGAPRSHLDNPDGGGSNPFGPVQPLGKVAFRLAGNPGSNGQFGAFAEIALNNQYQVKVLEKQIADLVWDTIDPNDPRIKSGTIKNAGHVFEQLYTTNAAIKIGVNLNDYLSCQWQTSGSIMRVIPGGGIEESSETISMSTSASVSISDLGALCDDMSVFFNRNANARGRTQTNLMNAKAQVNTIVQNALTIDFQMQSGGSTESWTWQQNMDEQNANDAFEAKLTRMKNRTGWFAPDPVTGDQPSIFEALFIPDSMGMTHAFALSNGIRVDSALNIQDGTFNSTVQLFDTEVWDLFNPQDPAAGVGGAAIADDHPDLGRIKGGVRLSIGDQGYGSMAEIEIPLSYTKTFAPAALRGVASGRVDSGMSIKVNTEGDWEFAPSSLIQLKFLEMFQYDYDIIQQKGELKAQISRGGTFKKLSEIFSDAFNVKTAVNWDIDLSYDFQTGAYSASAGLGFELYKELFNFSKFHSAFGSLMLQVEARTYIRATNTNSSEGFTTGGVFWYAGFGGRLIWNNRGLSWLGFPIDIHPWMGFGASVSFTFAASQTTLQSHTEYHTANGSTQLNNATDTLGWGAFLGLFGWSWQLADNIRQYLYLRHTSWMYHIPIFGPLLGSIAGNIPVLSKLGKREPIVTYLIRAQTARSYLCFIAALTKCDQERHNAMLNIGKLFLQAYLNTRPRVATTATPWIHQTRDNEWANAERHPSAANHQIRLARATIYYLARSMGYFTMKSPYCLQDPTELAAIRGNAFPSGNLYEATRQKPVPGHRNWTGACNRNYFHALNPFAHDAETGTGSPTPYTAPTATSQKLIGSPLAPRPKRSDGAIHTHRKEATQYREFGFWNGYEMLKAFEHVPRLFPDGKVPRGIGGEMGPVIDGEKTNKTLLSYYQEWLLSHPKCDCIKRHYEAAQTSSEYWNIFAINSITNMNVKDAFVQMGRHTQDTIVGKILKEVADGTFDALVNLNLETDVDINDLAGDKIVEQISQNKLNDTIDRVYRILVEAHNTLSSRYHYASNFRHKNKDKLDRTSRYSNVWFEDSILAPETTNTGFLDWIASAFSGRHAPPADGGEVNKYISRDEFQRNTLDDMDEHGSANCGSWKKIFCIFGDLIGSAFAWIIRFPFKVLTKINPLQWFFGTLRSLWNVYKIDKDYLINHEGKRFVMRGVIPGEHSRADPSSDDYRDLGPNAKYEAHPDGPREMLKSLCHDPEITPVDGTTPYSLIDTGCLAVVNVYPRQWYAKVEEMFAAGLTSAAMNPALPTEIKEQPLRSTFLINGTREEIEQDDDGNWLHGSTTKKEGFYSVLDPGNNGGVCVQAMNQRSELDVNNEHAHMYKKYSFYLWDLINFPVTAGIFDFTKPLADDLHALHVTDLQTDTLKIDRSPGADGVSDRCGLCMKKSWSTDALVVPPVTIELQKRKDGLISGGWMMNPSNLGWWDHQNQIYNKGYGRLNSEAAGAKSDHHNYYSTVVWFDNEDVDGSPASDGGEAQGLFGGLATKPIISDITARDDHGCSPMWEGGGGGGTIGITDYISGNHFLITGDEHAYNVLHQELGNPVSLKRSKLTQHMENFYPCLDWENVKDSDTKDVTAKDLVGNSQQSLMGLIWMPKEEADDPARYNSDAIPGAVGEPDTAAGVANGGFVFQSHFDDELHKQIFKNTKDGETYSCSELLSKWIIAMWQTLDMDVVNSSVRTGYWANGTGGDGKDEYPDRWNNMARPQDQHGAHKHYREEHQSWGNPNAYGTLRGGGLSHVTPMTTKVANIPHGWTSSYDFAGFGYPANYKYLRGAEIFYGLKSLWTMLLSSVTYSSLPHVKSVQETAVRYLKAQAKIIEMVWRTQMLQEISSCIPGNGMWSTVALPHTLYNEPGFLSWLTGVETRFTGWHNRLGGEGGTSSAWKKLIGKNSGYCGHINFCCYSAHGGSFPRQADFENTHAGGSKQSFLWSWMHNRGRISTQLLFSTWDRTMWAWGAHYGNVTSPEFPGVTVYVKAPVPTNWSAGHRSITEMRQRWRGHDDSSAISGSDWDDSTIRATRHIGWSARKAHWNDHWWRLMFNTNTGVAHDFDAASYPATIPHEQQGGMVGFMRFCPMQYLAKTFNMARGTNQNNPFSSDPAFKHEVRGASSPSTSLAIGEDHKKNSVKLMEYDITRFNGGYFGADDLASPGTWNHPANEVIYNSTFGGWQTIGSAKGVNPVGGIFYRSAAGRSQPSGGLGGRPHVFGSIIPVWKTNRDDPRCMCELPSHEAWIGSSTDSLDRQALTWMWEQMVSCHKQDRWTQMLDRPQWMRDGAYVRGYVTGHINHRNIRGHAWW